MADYYTTCKKRADAFVKRYKKLFEDVEKKEKQKKTKHVLSIEPKYGYYTRGQEYRSNCYFHIKGSAKEKVYNSCTQVSYKFSYPKIITINGTDYRTFLGGTVPYKNQCHHLLPDEVFSEKSNRFTAEHMDLLKRVPYSINRGENLIFLPVNEKFCRAHKLPYHRGSHPEYNDLVAGKMDKVRDSLDKMKTKPCDGKNSVTKNTYTELGKAETHFWKWHIKKGKLNALNVRSHAITDLEKPKKGRK